MHLRPTSLLGLIAACSFSTFFITASRSISIKLFILAGQSNKGGFRSNMNELPDRLKKSQEKVIWYNNSNQWLALQPPTEPSLLIQYCWRSRNWGINSSWRKIGPAINWG